MKKINIFSDKRIKAILLDSLTDPERFIVENFEHMRAEKICELLRDNFFGGEPVKVASMKRYYNQAIKKMNGLYSYYQEIHEPGEYIEKNSLE
jgi:hypothetical protein